MRGFIFQNSGFIIISKNPRSGLPTFFKIFSRGCTNNEAGILKYINIKPRSGLCTSIFRAGNGTQYIESDFKRGL